MQDNSDKIGIYFSFHCGGKGSTEHDLLATINLAIIALHLGYKISDLDVIPGEPSPDEVKEWISKQMDDKKVFILIIGKETYSSSWVQKEITMANANGIPIIGIYVDGIDNKGNEKGENPLKRTGYNYTCYRPLSNGDLEIETPDGTEIHKHACNTAMEIVQKKLPEWIDEALNDKRTRRN